MGKIQYLCIVKKRFLMRLENDTKLIAKSKCDVATLHRCSSTLVPAVNAAGNPFGQNPVLHLKHIK